MLRCIQMGLSVADLELMDYGFVLDMMIEAGNDHEKYDYIATQEDFDAF